MSNTLGQALSGALYNSLYNTEFGTLNKARRMLKVSRTTETESILLSPVKLPWFKIFRHNLGNFQIILVSGQDF
jgi:hypothetical protein